MSAGTLLPETIRAELAAMQRQDRELTALRGIGQGLKWLCLAWAACLLADAVWNLSPVVRTGMLAALVGLTVFAMFRFVWRVQYQRRSWAELAATVERDHPELSERLVTLVELSQDSRQTGSPVMQSLLAKQTARAVAKLNFTDSLPAGRSLQTAAIGLIALALLLLPFLLPGQRYALLWGRLIMPFGNHAWGTRVAIRVIDGDRVIPRGGDVAITAEVQGLSPDQQATAKLRLFGRDAEGRTREQPLAWQPEAQQFTATLSRLEHELTYRIESHWAASPEYRLAIANRPAITAWTIQIEPPPYTGLPATTLQSAVNELRVPERSRVRFQWRFAEPVTAGVIAWPASVDEAKKRTEVELLLAADGLSASVEQTASASGRFHIKLTSPRGLDSDEPERQLTLIADEPPEITVASDLVPKKVRPDDVLTIPAAVLDDYGLSAWELHWQTSTGEKGVVATPADQLLGPALDTDWPFSLSEHALIDGQAVTLRWRAADHYPAPGPHETWSDPLVIAISTDVESLESRAVAEAQESLDRELDALREAVAEQQAAVDDRHRKTAREAVKGEQQPENQAALEELHKKQEAIEKQLAAVQEELAERPFLDQAAAERMPAVESALDEAERSLGEAAKESEARDQIENLSRALDELDKAQDQLDKLSQETKALAALEQELAELSRLSRRAEQLAQEAERLSKDQPDENGDKNQEQQASKPEHAADQNAADRESLRKETEQLTEHLDDLLRRRPELLEAARNAERERLSQLGEIAERLADRQQELADAMSNESNSTATPNEDRPADATSPGENEPKESETPSGDTPQTSGEKPDSQPADAEQGNSPSPSKPQALAGSQPDSATGSESEPAMEQNPGDNTGEPSDNSATPAEQQQQLSEAANALRQALAESAERLSQAPLESPSDGENAAAASEAVESAQQSMAEAEEKSSAGDTPAAGEAAQEAQRQLQEASERASQKNSETESPSPSSQRVPPAAAKQVSEASRQLNQAREAVECACKNGKPGSGKSGSKSASGSSGKSGSKTPGSEDSTAENSTEPGQGDSENQANADKPANSKPGDAKGNADGESNSDVARSAEQLRQAAKALAAASQARQRGTSGRAQAGKSKSEQGQAQKEAQQPGEMNHEPGESSEPTEGFAEFGAGSTALGDDAGAAPSDVGPKAGSRNWGRLPPHLKNEIRQGTTKTPHPEYAPQIKRYFERIAEPAKARKRP